jgi:hypothetical protein
MEINIKKMFEEGFAIRRISQILKLDEKYIKEIIKTNNIVLLKEDFSEDKIEHICDLYSRGVSAKQLGIKYSIDKRRIQKWISKYGELRSKYNSHRFTDFNQNLFDVIDTEEKAYWLGFLYADCYNCLTTNTVSLSLQINDFDHLCKLSKAIGLPIDKISYTKNKEGYEYYTLKMYSKHLCNTLAEKGCPQAKSFIITYPSWLNESLTVPFIRGLFDGDGSLAHRINNEWKWSLATTKECGESIQNIILKQLDMTVNLSYISKTNHNTYELESNGNEKVLKLSNWLYGSSKINTRLDRKYNRYLELMQQQNNRKINRNNYNISEEEKKVILYKSDCTSNDEIAKNHSIHPSTVSRIKQNDKYKYEKIVTINNNLITDKYVKTLNTNERELLVNPLFNHFRNQGWLYPDNTTKLRDKYKKLCNTTFDLTNTELYNNGSLATDICKYFCHKFYESTESNKLNMIQIFNDDIFLRKVIRNRLGLDWSTQSGETFNISFRMLIQGMRSARLVPSISMFKPNIAKYLYMKYSNSGDTVFDYSAGWGGRLLGAASCGRKYIGVDPLTTDELSSMIKFLNIENVSLIKNGSEHVKLDENSIDFSFSSPPYFDQEIYSNDSTQAYSNGEDYFYNIYWKNTLLNVKYMLKPNKIFGLNVKNYPKMLDMAKEIFGDIHEIINLRTVRSHLNKSAGTTKFEHIYIFKNIK